MDLLVKRCARLMVAEKPFNISDTLVLKIVEHQEIVFSLRFAVKLIISIAFCVLQPIEGVACEN
jgi:hypothetical protein